MRREPSLNEDNDDSVQVVHEAEAQRQYPRVRLPGRVHVRDGKHDQAFPLHDLSAGGLSFVADGPRFKTGQTFDAWLELTVQPVTFTLRVKCEVRNTEGKRVGCQFLNLGAGEISALRRLITGTLAGELVATGDVIHALSRENFVKSREVKDAGAGLSGPARARALLMTALMFTLGLIAFAYALDKLYEMAFVTRSTAAKIAAPTFVMSMPRDGTFFSLVPENNIVKKGQPIASFQAAMLDVIQGDVGNLKLSAAELSQLMGETLKGTLSSPCDCVVQQRNALDGQYVNRGQPLFELVTQNATPYVLARFHFDDIDKLPVGRGVSFRIYGQDQQHFGKIRDVRLLPPQTQITDPGANDVRGLNSSSTISDVIATIEPLEPIGREWIDRPVDVTLSKPVVLEAMSSSFFSRVGSLLFGGLHRNRTPQHQAAPAQPQDQSAPAQDDELPPDADQVPAAEVPPAPRLESAPAKRKSR
jgi:alginate biosynthesis protein Alg44